MTHLCDCCEEPSTDLAPSGFVEIVLLVLELEGKRVRYTNAEIHAAPRRPARWCSSCLRTHAAWKRKVGNAALAARPAAELAPPPHPRTARHAHTSGIGSRAG